MSRWNWNDRSGLMNAALTLYAILVIIACVLWLATGVNLRPQLALSIWSIPLGLLGVIPMLPALTLSVRLRDLVSDLVGRQLAQCRPVDLVVLAALAGFGEELLFRGALQEWAGRWGFFTGLVITNVVFGLLHALTVSYFLFATVIGFYLSGLAEVGEGRHLIPCMIAHAVYDLIAFMVIRREWNARDAREPEPVVEPDGGSPAAEEGAPVQERPSDVS